MNKNTECWNNATQEPNREKEKGYYLTNLFLFPIKKAMGYTPQIPQKILKVDLWNEGIDHERNILKHLSQHVCYGIDIAVSTCLLAKKHQDDIFVTTGSITSLPYRNAVFSLLLDLSTSDHVPQEKLQQICHEYARVLQDKGMLVLVFDHWGMIWKLYMWYLEKIRCHDDSFFKNTEVPSRYFHSIKKYKKLLHDAGFIIQEEYAVDYASWTWNRLTYPFWKRVSSKGYDCILNADYSRVSKYCTFLGKQYVIIAQKKR
jgi:SAM-dependent methyltransferase